ncbi:MAG: aspartate aminotransferase family protein [Rhodospirillales bacterium]|nr:aspartate aminotransferase family protein [Rhodospirillales bacterium]MDE2318196.1 aspartate aminotransferase family protein [Rhodospirillales bacterium]
MLNEINLGVDWQALDAAHHFHPFTDHKELHEQGVRLITSAEGVYLHDSNGNKIMDGMAGLWCVAVGYGRQELVEAATRQMTKLPYYNSFFKTTNEPAVLLAKKLAEISPPGFEHVFFACSGSEAVDSAIRNARVYWKTIGKPEKKIVIGREYGYHGSTILGASAGGMKDMHRQGGDLPHFAQVLPPYWYGKGGQMSPEEFGLYAAREAEKKIQELGPENIAAFIGEPIQGAGGVLIPPSTYWPEINRICKQYDILLIADEVICGYGRTGKMFGTDTFGIQPDMMTTAKGLTSGYLPLSALLMNNRVADVLINQVGEYYHGFTYSGHPVSCAVGLRNLQIIEDEKLVEGAARKGELLREKLNQAIGDLPIVGEIRGVGLIGAIELTADRRTRKFFEKNGRVGGICRDHCIAAGLMMRATRDTMLFSPPLTISEAEIEKFAAMAKIAFEATFADVRAEVAL